MKNGVNSISLDKSSITTRCFKLKPSLDLWFESTLNLKSYIETFSQLFRVKSKARYDFELRIDS